MSIKQTIIIPILLSLLFALPTQAQGPDHQTQSTIDNTDFVSGEILVKFRPNVGTLGAQSSLRASGLAPLEIISQNGTLRVKVEPGQEAATINALKERGDIEFATVNHVISIANEPNDTWYSFQWALDHTNDADIDAPEAWSYNTGGDEIIIAILDTGIDLDHPDLQANIVNGATFIPGTSTPDDDHGHGTHVAGIAAAIGNNNLGIAGVSWRAKLMPVKVLSASGSGSDSTVSQGIEYAVNNGAHIINMSLGAAYTSYPCSGFDTISNAINYAKSQGVLVVAAAGNESVGKVSCPSAYDEVISVSSTTSSNSLSSFSNYGPRVDVSAPGSSIYSTLRGGGYGYQSGTSMATPYVAGLAALILSFETTLNADQVRNILETTVDDLGTVGWDQLYGHGRINAQKAIESLIIKNDTSSEKIIGLVGDNITPPLISTQLETNNPSTITWTASVSPTVDWISSIPASNGIISASAPGNLLIQTTYPITHGTYTTTLILLGKTNSDKIFTQTRTIELLYTSHIHQLHIPLIRK
ncbi:MAG: S8 family peptidase [Chloroflexota bacterium]